MKTILFLLIVLGLSACGPIHLRRTGDAGPVAPAVETVLPA